MKRTLIGILSGLLLVFSAAPFAEEEQPPTIREIVESEAQSEQLLEEAKAKGQDQRADRSTPRSALISLSLALDEGQYERAAEGMDMRYLSGDIRKEDAALLLRQLRYIFIRHVWIDVGVLSDDPRGNLEDGLPSYRESFGTIRTADGDVGLYLQKVPDGKGGRAWKISNTTVMQIPALWEEFGHSDFAGEVADFLPMFERFGIDNWQWAYLAVFILVLVSTVAAVSYLLNRYGQQPGRAWMLDVRRYLHGSLGFFLYITLLRLFMLDLGLSLKARAIFDSFLLVYLAHIFLVLGIIELFATRTRRRMEKAGHPSATVVVRPISAVVKMTAVALLTVTGLDNAGYDVTTIIAGLGVSSIAVALAAQKTLENLIGAITLYIARPVKPGDFCRVGDNVGTIEAIGLRSTQLRTTDRTIVDIPNGTLSGLQIENFARRDNIRFYRMFRLRLASSPDQLRYLLAKLREMLYAHPGILTDTVSVRLFDITEQAYLVRMDSRVVSSDFQQYLAIAEDMNLRIIDLVHETGTNFAYPSQTIMVEDPATLDASDKQRSEALVEQWREEDRYPFPQWGEDHVEQIENTLDFPPRGSPNNPRNREMGVERG
jgi:MscS family membrane protein